MTVKSSVGVKGRSVKVLGGHHEVDGGAVTLLTFSPRESRLSFLYFFFLSNEER